MDAQLENAFRIIHIASGSIALITGVSALLMSPKIQFHRLIGKSFFYAMIAVFATAVILAVQNGIDFLFCIAILSFFSVIIGIRALKFLKGGKPGLLDWSAVLILVLAGFYLSGKGALAAFSSLSGGIILYLIFGTAMILYGFMTGSELIKTKPRSSKWFTLHKSNMGAALIATITAFSTTTMDFLPSILPWIWPSMVFSPLLSWYIRKNSPETP